MPVSNPYAGNIASSAGSGAATGGMLGGPIGAGIGLAAGAAMGYLKSRAQKQLQDRLREVASPEHLNDLRAKLVGMNSGAFQAIQQGAEMTAGAEQGRAESNYARAGLSGMGESHKTSAALRSFLTSRKASSALSLEIMKQAQQQQQTQLAALQGIMQTPHGAADPLSASLAGAGSGLEAFTNAKYADAMAGRTQ
jgi:hypothetical protein